MIFAPRDAATPQTQNNWSHESKNILSSYPFGRQIIFLFLSRLKTLKVFCKTVYTSPIPPIACSICKILLIFKMRSLYCLFFSFFFAYFAYVFPYLLAVMWLKRTDDTVFFDQLLRMCDAITHALGGAVYSVYKYAPIWSDFGFYTIIVTMW